MLLRCRLGQKAVRRAYDASLARYRHIDGGRTAGAMLDGGNDGNIGRKTAQKSRKRLQNGYAHYWRMSTAMVKVGASQWREYRHRCP